MKGLELSKRFYEEILKDKLKENIDFPIAVCLMGYGSECYGYDDSISIDHDFSAMPLILVKHKDYYENIEVIEKFLDELPKEYLGYKTLDESIWGLDRRGIIDIEKYTYMFLGSENGPEKDENFRNIPEYLLSSFTNGEIFLDEFGEITKLREKVKYYPEDIRLNKMATRCMNINSSFVNFERSTMRNDEISAFQALSLFINNVIEMYFLINRKYAPYYKWQHKMLSEIDEIANDLLESLLIKSKNYLDKIDMMVKICEDIVDRLENENLVTKSADFIGFYGPILQSKIKNEKIRSIGCWSD